MIAAALKLANSSECRCKHGAVITRGGSVIGRGRNSYKPHRTWGGGPLNTLHAEAAAIRDAVRRGCNLKGATIYVARAESASGSMMSRPCESCQQLIEDHGIRKVFYTNEEGEIVAEWPL